MDVGLVVVLQGFRILENFFAPIFGWLGVYKSECMVGGRRATDTLSAKNQIAEFRNRKVALAA